MHAKWGGGSVSYATHVLILHEGRDNAQCGHAPLASVLPYCVVTYVPHRAPKAYSYTPTKHSSPRHSAHRVLRILEKQKACEQQGVRLHYCQLLQIPQLGWNSSAEIIIVQVSAQATHACMPSGEAAAAAVSQNLFQHNPHRYYSGLC